MSTFVIDLLSGKEFLFNGTFVNSGTTIFTGITSGNNGISIGAPHQLKLGGTLTCSTVLLKGIGNTAGVEYGGDYSASFSNRSLVDKGYVTGITSTKLNITDFNTYSAATKTNFNTYSAATKTNFNTYSAATKTILDGKVVWKNVWTGGTYQKNDMVRDGTWTMIANKVTSDNAAPQAVGESRYLYYPNEPSSLTTTAKQIVYGMQYSGTLPYWLNGYRVHVVAGNHYEIILVRDPLGANQVNFINAFDATATGWREFGLVAQPISAGATYQILAIENEPDPTPILTTANYNYQKPNNWTTPTAGQIIHAGKLLNTLSIYNTDNNSINRTALLSSLVAGDIIVVGNMRWAVQIVTNIGTYHDIVVAPANQAPVGGVQTFTFETVTSTPLSYVADINHWTGSTQVKGVFGTDTGWENASINSNQYGIDINIQNAYVSPDWDFVTNQGSGTGGGGATITSTSLQQVTQVGAITDVESTFNGGLITQRIKPTGNTTTAIQVTKANGTTAIINVDTVSGFTGFGTTVPKRQIHTYGSDSSGAFEDIQTNGIGVDGPFNVDKDVVWFENGNPKWAAQTYRNENSKFWYLFNADSQNISIVASETGRMGINGHSNTMDYHAALTAGSGPNDIMIGGVFTQNSTIIYEITTVGTGNPNTYKWRISKDNGFTYSAYSSISGMTSTPVNLIYGVTAKWEKITGHTSGTTWIFPAFAQLPVGTFVVNSVGFNEAQYSYNWSAGTVIYEDITAIANNANINTEFILFNTGTTLNAIYFGSLIQIGSIFVNLGSGGASMLLILEYWNGTTWVNITSNNNNYIDGTLNLTQSGSIQWEIETINDWVKSNIPNLPNIENNQYWLRLRTSTNPTIAPVVRSFARGGDKRFAVFTSPSDFIPSMYVDSLGRTNIGGGNITGANLLQINTAQNLQNTSFDSMIEFDGEDSNSAALRLKLNSEDNKAFCLFFVKGRGDLTSNLSVVSGDSTGDIIWGTLVGASLPTEGGSINVQYVGTGNTRTHDMIFKTHPNNGCVFPSEIVRMTGIGNTGFGISNPNALVHLKAGNTTCAPLKLTAGSFLTTPQVGAIEFDGFNFKFTVSGSTIRKTFAPLESPQFSGNTNLPSTTCLNSTNLCNFILCSGGGCNNSVVKTCNYNAFTANTAQVITVAVTGATNGLTKSNGNNVVWGGSLTQDTIITGNTFNLNIGTKAITLCGLNGIRILDTSNQGIDISSNGGSVDLRGATSLGVEKTKILVSDTIATFTDSRTTPTGIQYNADYSLTYTARSLVDKGYVDSIITGISVKEAVLVTTVSNINLAVPPSIIDGVTMTNNKRVLVKNQTSGQFNGIYEWHASGMTRSQDFDGTPSGEVVNGSYMVVLSGSTYKNTSWILTTPNPITINVTLLTFALYSAVLGIIAGNGICVTQSGGDNVIDIKLASAGCGLCSDASGLCISPTIGGVGICYGSGTLCFDGASVAGNSLSWTGTQLAVNTTGGTLNTALNSKLNITAFNTYSGLTLTNINSRALQTSINTYTGTTAPNTYALKASINTYTGTTVPNTYVNKTNFNIYTGATHTCMDRHAYLSGATFTGAVHGNTPTTNDNSTCFATTAYYIGQAGTANPLMNAGICVGTSNLFSRQDHVHPKDSTKLSLSGGTMTGALVINSNLTATGTTILRGTTCLGVPAVGSISTDRTLFYNPTTCAITAIKLTGGSDSYFYNTSNTSTSTASATCVLYLSASSANFLAGRYQIDFDAQIGNSANGGTTLVKFGCDNIVIGANYCYIAASNAGSHLSVSMTRDLTMTAGCHCLTIHYWAGANTACIFTGAIRAKRIC